ncbi:MAG: D-alanyl-D-alanine carboxypeptidase family protein, partial [Allosphingosinicella sp.]
EESVNLMDWGFRACKSQPLLNLNGKVADAQVQGGGDDVVPLVAPRSIAVTLPAGAAGSIRAKVVYNGPIKAPIAKGQHVADLVVTTADTPPQTMPLVASEAVGEAGFFGRMWNGLTSLFG